MATIEETCALLKNFDQSKSKDQLKTYLDTLVTELNKTKPLTNNWISYWLSKIYFLSACLIVWGTLFGVIRISLMVGQWGSKTSEILPDPDGEAKLNFSCEKFRG